MGEKVSDDTVTDGPVELDENIFDDDIDIDEIPDNPNHLPEDVYYCRVTEAKMALTKRKDKVGITVKYQIAEGPYSSSFPFTEWLWVPRKNGEDREWEVDEVRAFSRLKKHFVAAGFGVDEIKSIKPSLLVGTFIKVQTKNRTDDKNVERIGVRDVIIPEEGDGDTSIFGSAANDI